ncbi:SUN domain-containing protein 1-like [Lates japonicus]
MLRRSNRLLEAGYYTEEGTPRIKYKEILYRVFQKRWTWRSINPSADTTPSDAEVWDQTDLTSVMQTRGIKSWIFSTKSISCFLLILLFAFGIPHLYLNLNKVQQTNLDMDLNITLTHKLPNFAVESQGARVLQHLSTDTYWPRKSIGLVWDRIFYWLYSSQTQRQVIQGHSSLQPGRCWCFPGDRGHLFIELSHPVSITHVTLGHITKSQSPYGSIASASREFSIHGMRTEADAGTDLGRLTYDQDGVAFQTFKLTNSDDAIFRYAKLQVENNWGNMDYTCVYSFRVHGCTLPLAQCQQR